GGGTPGYTIGWGNGESTNPATALCGGITGVTITDANNCTASTSVTITEPTAIVVALNSATNPLCNGDCNGTATLDVSGGTAPYTYLWENGETTNPATALCDGVTGVTVTDANNCTQTFSVTLTEPAPLLANISAFTDVLCFGECTGTATLNVAGGTIPYSYDWGNGETTNPATGLCAGNGVVTITDVNGCSTTANYSITEPANPLVIGLAATDITCNGENDGEIDLTVNGGTPGYTYLWSNSASSEDITGLAPNNYSVTVTDANGCRETDDIDITEPNPIVITETITNSHCLLADGQISLVITGGNGNNSFVWNPNTGAWDGTNYTGLVAGSYSVTVTDDQGCSETETYAITDEDAGTVAIINIVNNNCFGESNGQAFAQMTGGTAPFTYLWSSGGTNQLETNLPAGIICVTVTDASGCLSTGCETITEPDSIEMTAAITDVTCLGGSDGEIYLTVIGGTSPYTYLWSGGQLIEDIEFLSANTYSVVVTDANGCTNTDAFVVNEPATGINLSFVVSNVSCFGENDGAIDMTVSNGTLPYTYSWTGGLSTEDISGLAPGTYFVTVEDVNGCTASDSETITEPTEIIITPSITNPHCGLADGSISIAVTGGSGVYANHDWSPDGFTGDGTITYSNLPAGLYSVTTTDNEGCTASASIPISDEVPGTLSFINVVNNTCFGNTNGSATVQITGGDAIATYDWSPDGFTGDGTDTYSDLPAGFVNIMVTDINGCVYAGNIEITEPDSIEITGVTTDVLCFGDCNGEIDLSVIGGTIPYSFAWTGGYLSEDISGLCANTYSVTITDDNGCTNTTDFIVNEPLAPITLSLTGTDASCNGENDGTIDLSVSGGTLPLSFEWSSGILTEDLVGLIAGTYTVTVTDDNGCTASDSYTINEPTAISANATIVNSHCTLSDGSVALTVSGGAGGYSYDWSPDGFTGDGTDTYSDLPAGTYDVEITDATGCSITEAYIVTDEDAGTLSFIDVQNNPCFGNSLGQATVEITGGAGGYTYLWSVSASSQITQTAINLDANTHFVTVTDLNGCQLLGSIEITEPDELIISLTGTDILCNGECTGEIDLTVSGGTIPYGFVWSNFETTEDLTALCEGTYFVTVTDDNSCEASDNITISQPPLPIDIVLTGTDVNCFGGNDGAIDMTVSGGTAPYTFEWSNTELTEDISGLIAGIYNVTVTDANGCTAEDSYTINQPDSIEITFTISPSHCGIADGSVVAAVVGGTTAYSYDWSPDGFTGDGTDTYSDLSFGNYTIVITDANGCTASDIASVSDADVGTLNFDSIPASCYGICDGEATVNIIGGDAAASWAWGDGQNTQTATGLCAGIASVVVTDINGCGLAGTVEITQPDSIEMIFNVTNVVCFGETNGEIDLEVSGGTVPYTYSWSNTLTDEDLTGLSAGPFTVTVTDANGCTNTDGTIINEPLSPLSLVISGTTTNCYGDSTGTATATPSGGVPNYHYLWSNGDTLQTATGLPAGTHTVTVTDDYGCTIADSYTVIQPDSLYATFTDTVQVFCDGLCTGSATVTPVGGTPPYIYIWEDGQTDSTAIGLCAGIFCVTVIDANLCEFFSCIEITDTSNLLLTITDTLHPQCAGDCNGSLVAVVTGGTTPYTIEWSTGQIVNGEVSDTLVNLCPGTYYVTVYDINTCSREAMVDIIEPDTLFVNFTDSISPLCADSCNGMLTVTPIGGVSPYNYLWTTGGVDSTEINLCPGYVEVEVSDANGCIRNLNYTVSSPDPLDANFVVDTALCSNNSFDASINVLVTGGTAPYTYLWSNDSTSQSIDSLESGTYYITIIDANGCSMEDSVSTGAGIVVDALALADTIICYGDSVQLFGYGGDSIYWAPAYGLSDSLIYDPWASPLTTTMYYFTAWDSTGSCFDVDSALVFVRPQIEVLAWATDSIVLLDYSTTLNIDNFGNDGLTFLWFYSDSVEYPGVIDDPTSMNPTVTPLVTTEFYLLTTSPDGCTRIDTVKVKVIPKIIFPTGISPNGDNLNDTWEIDYIGFFEQVHITIYNRWGEKLFEYAGSGAGYEQRSNQWDGTFNGKDLPVGTYYFTIDFYNEMGTKPVTGPITIIR
ncbi:MAG: gliding motility-associated C-terminal domain-containing protein, partial [Bacteroidales bacterium]|nr:gliding motility-associated C-terminal domain-containing protein [Bacteroidales bacterium]